jgi:exopolysaccharide production protein ExoQ
MIWKSLKLRKESIAKFEVAVTFLLLMFYVGALGIRVPIGGFNWNADLEQRNILEKVIAALSYLLIPFLVSRKWKLCIFLLTKNSLLVCLLFLTSFSIVWADTNLAQNISEVRGFLLSSLFGIYLAARFSIKEQTRLLAGVFGIVILLSIPVALFLPGYGIHPAQGDLSQLGGNWTGIFAHKNTFGPFMAWSAFIFLSLSLSIFHNNSGRLVSWVGFALSCILVFLSGSAGSLVNLLGIICLVFLSKFTKRTHYKLQVLLTVSLILLCGIISILILNNGQIIASAVGKDLTFTGRIPMWSELLDYIAQKPLLGYGFNGFWDSNQYGGVFRARWAWKDVPHSHNGFIELLLALGLLGFLLFVVDFILEFIRAFREVYRANTVEDIVPMQFLLSFLIANMSEAKLLVSNNIYWIIYIAMAFSLVAKQRQEFRK